MEQDVVVVPIVGELSARMRPADFDEARVTAACYHLRLALRLWPQLDDLVEWLMLEAVVVSEDGKEAV